MIFASSRLIARRFGLDDLADFVAMRNDPEVARYQSWERYSEDDGRRFIAELSGLEPGTGTAVELFVSNPRASSIVLFSGRAFSALPANCEPLAGASC